MVRTHVAQRSRGFVIPAALFHAHRFGRRDLHIVDVMAIPDRLENAVAEAEHHQVLHGLFAQVMVDPVNLRFLQRLLDVFIELNGGVEVAAERLLDDHARIMAVLLLG